MKIDVDPQVLRQIAAYCDEQQGVMDATRTYLDQYGKISLGDFGLLLMIARPFYELCRGATMSGFGLGAKLVKSRATAIHAYLDEQTAMENDNQSTWDRFSGILGQAGQGFSSSSGNGGGVQGGVHSARAVDQVIPNFQDAQHGGTVPQPNPNGGGGGISPTDRFQHVEQELNPQPLPPIDRPGGADDPTTLNPQPLPPVAETGGLQHVDQDLNPQPLPPGPPQEVSHAEAFSGRQEVMDRVWQERSSDDPLGRSPQQLQALWQAREPVQPPAPDAMGANLQYQQMQGAMQNENRSFTAVSNIMKVVSDSQMSIMSNIK